MSGGIKKKLQMILLAVLVLEICIIFVVSMWIGFLPTLAILIGMSVLGLIRLRQLGLSNLSNPQAMQSKIQSKGVPILRAVLWLIPGFLTTFFGILLLIPKMPALLGRIFMKRMASVIQAMAGMAGAAGAGGSPFQQGFGGKGFGGQGFGGQGFGTQGFGTQGQAKSANQKQVHGQTSSASSRNSSGKAGSKAKGSASAGNVIEGEWQPASNDHSTDSDPDKKR